MNEFELIDLKNQIEDELQKINMRKKTRIWRIKWRGECMDKNRPYNIETFIKYENMTAFISEMIEQAVYIADLTIDKLYVHEADMQYCNDFQVDITD